MNRREALGLLMASLLPVPAWAQKAPLIEVWRSPSCGCCGAWVKHLQDNGFVTRVHMVDDTASVRRAAGIPDHLASCHTAKVGGYAIEGHVPASDIRRLLAEKPAAVGLSAPGMPPGSPGMDIPDSPPYEVVIVDKGGQAKLYARHEGPKKKRA